MMNSKAKYYSVLSFVIVMVCAACFCLGLIVGHSMFTCTCVPFEPCDSVGINTSTDNHDTTIFLDRATTYQPTIEQCDSTPFSTASGAKINPDDYQEWIAVSRDLHERWGGPLSFGDTVTAHSDEHPNFNGKWVVQDIMAPKYKLSIDFLLETWKNVPKLGIGTDFGITFSKN